MTTRNITLNAFTKTETGLRVSPRCERNCCDLGSSV
jgi:hypothetical protein